MGSLVLTGEHSYSRGVEFPTLLTAAEVAAALRVTPKTVSKWARDGEVAAIRLPGGTLRIPETELQRLIDGGNPGAATDAA
jgi:excisionase family DNA binding protein